MSKIDLNKLAEPFPADDIEWRASRCGIGSGGIFCMVLAYITARAISARLDDVCGIENWKNEPCLILELKPGSVAMQTGISIKINGEWVTKWDVSEPTSDHGQISAPAKGGFSGAMKRAGAQWGIGRYLYYLDETFAEVSPDRMDGWNYARLPKDKGGEAFYWQTPRLPGWALPKESDQGITEKELTRLKNMWMEKFAMGLGDPEQLRDGFSRFVGHVVGDFPLSDFKCWSRDAYDKCRKRIEETKDINSPSPDVPFEE